MSVLDQEDDQEDRPHADLWEHVRLHRVLRASPERVFRAFLEPDAMAKWLPPYGFTATAHHMDARVGGTYRVSFANFASGKGHSFGGTPNSHLPPRFDIPTISKIEHARRHAR